MSNKTFNLNETVSSYSKYEEALVQRIEFARTVIGNTLRKFPKDVWPAELTWAAKTGQASQISLKSFTPAKNKEEKHTLTFNAIYNLRNNEKFVREVSLTNDLLRNDPIAVAQYARKLIHQRQAELQREVEREEAKTLADLTAQIAKLQSQCDILKASSEKRAERRMKLAHQHAAMRQAADSK